MSQNNKQNGSNGIELVNNNLQGYHGMVSRIYYPLDSLPEKYKKKPEMDLIEKYKFEKQKEMSNEEKKNMKFFYNIKDIGVGEIMRVRNEKDTHPLAIYVGFSHLIPPRKMKPEEELELNIAEARRRANNEIKHRVLSDRKRNFETVLDSLEFNERAGVINSMTKQNNTQRNKIMELFDVFTSQEDRQDIVDILLNKLSQKDYKQKMDRLLTKLKEKKGPSNNVNSGHATPSSPISPLSPNPHPNTHTLRGGFKIKKVYKSKNRKTKSKKFKTKINKLKK